MTRFTLIACTFTVLCGSFAVHAEEAWEIQAPNPFPMQTAGELAFVDSNTGFMVGLGDTPLKTTDGGQTWSPVSVPQSSHNCVVALDSQHVWMFGNGGARSTDGGESWDDLGFITAYEAQFLTPQFGWISDGYAAQVTHNGGDSWTPAITGSTRIIYPDFATAQLGLGRQANFGSGVWRTTNGGQNWSKVLDTTITNVAFVSDTVAIAVGNGRIYRSADGGASWSDVGAGLSGYPQIIAFDDQHVLVNRQSACLRSDDGGLTWITIATPSANLSEVWIKNGTEAYATTNHGEILHSTDAFATWSVVQQATHIGLSDMEFLPDGAFVAAGSDVILRSTDGHIWNVMNSGVMRRVVDVEMFDAQRGLAIADLGFVLRTTDGGNQWVPSRPSYVQGYGWNYCNDLFVLSDNVAYVAGDGGPGPMIKTTDGGETWEPMAYPVTTHIESIWFVDEQHGWIGRGFTTGWIYRTADGGETWEEVWPQSYGGIWDIQFNDLNAGWALRGGNAILVTTNGGDTWLQRALPSPHTNDPSYVKFQFINDDVGYAVGAAGDVCKSIDGGLTWVGIETNTLENFRDLKVLDENTLWVVGANNTRLFSDDGGQTWESVPVAGVDLPAQQTWYSIDIRPNGETRLAGTDGLIVRSGVDEPEIPADIDGNGVVDVFDLLTLLANWGTNGPGSAIAPPTDVVDVFDLIELLAAWTQ